MFCPPAPAAKYASAGRFHVLIRFSQKNPPYSGRVHAGAGVLTHAFNGMRGIGHRAPGPVLAAMDHPTAVCELINDGQHVHPPVARLLLRGMPGRVALVTDAIAELGHKVETVEIVTHGDRSTAALTQIGGTGVFVSALRDALLAGEIDAAVHSYKDLPTAPATSGS